MADLNKNIDLMPYINALLNEWETTYLSVKERGAKYYWRPLLIAVATVGITYQFFYMPPGVKLGKLSARFESAQISLAYADRYIGVRDKLLSIYPLLPTRKDRDGWLTESVIQALKTSGVTAQSMSPPSETEEGGLVFQSVAIQLDLSFKELIRMIYLIEEEVPLMHMDSLELQKKAGELGVNRVSAKLSTVVVVRTLAP